MTRKFLVDVEVPVLKITDAVLFDDEAANLGEVKTRITASETAQAPKLLPAGGTTGQVVVKSSNTDYDVTWATGSTGTNQTCFPFFKSDGSSSKIQTTTAGGLPFFKSNGTQDDIALGAC